MVGHGQFFCVRRRISVLHLLFSIASKPPVRSFILTSRYRPPTAAVAVWSKVTLKSVHSLLSLPALAAVRADVGVDVVECIIKVYMDPMIFDGEEVE